MGLERLPSTCYILSDESSIPFYSTSNGYKNNSHFKGLYTFFVKEKEESLDSFRYVAIISLHECFNFLIVHFINNVCAKFRGNMLNSF